jgi:type I restriction enzyme S subunit
MEVKESSARYLAKPAYKQTDVGMIPEDWEVKPIGDIHPFVTSGSRGWAAFYSEFGSPFIRITNLSRECIYPDLSDLRFVSIPCSNSEGSRTQLKDGDVLISITADIGIVGYVTTQMPKPAYINQHIALVRFDTTQTCPLYVSYFLAAERTQKLFRSLTDSGAKAGMNLATVKQIKVTFPPSAAEQQAIAEALSDADALIEALEQLLVKKGQIKQGAMQELLTGQKRLPGFAEEWGVKSLGELVEIRKGELITEKSAIHGLIPVVAGGKKPAYFHNVANRWGKTITISGSGASAGYVAFFDMPIFASDCSTISESANYAIEFIYFVLLLNQNAIYKAQTGGAQPHIHPNDLRPMTVSVPKAKAEQTAIATVLSDMDAEIAAVVAKLAKARQIKQGMMQELLTGRIRLV